MNNKLTVFIEINGTSIYVGDIIGDTPARASFTYSPEYLLNPENRPISISLPLTKAAFSPEQTKTFFDGLRSPSGRFYPSLCSKLDACR